MSNVLNLLSEETFAAKMDVQNAMLAAIAAQSGGLTISSWSDVQQLVRLGLASKLFSVGDQLVCNRGEETLVWDVIGIDHDTPTDKTKTHSMTLQLHDCLPKALQYSAKSALYYAQAELEAGTYSFTCKGRLDYTRDNDKSFQFTLSAPIPAGGQIVVETSAGETLNGKTVKTYSSATATVAIETITLSEGSSGTALGATDGTDENVNEILNVIVGMNNWQQSAIRQMLNSSAEAGTFWTPQSKWDRPPSWNATQEGFLRGVDDDFLAVLGTVDKRTAIRAEENGVQYADSEELIFLLSRSEVYSGLENDVVENEPYPYYAQNSDLSAPGTDADSNRIKYRNNVAAYWWLRTPNLEDSKHNMRIIQINGNLSQTTPNNMIYTAPACCIV